MATEQVETTRKSTAAMTHRHCPGCGDRDLIVFTVGKVTDQTWSLICCSSCGWHGTRRRLPSGMWLFQERGD